MLALILLTAPAAEPTYVVVNKAGARYVVVNRVQAAACPCESNPCADARCQAYGGSGGCECRSGAAKTTAQPGTLTTASGRLIRQTATGYVYADEGEPPQVLDCSSGKCKWVDVGNRPAYLPNVAPANYQPIASYSPPIASYSSSACPNGNCGSARPATPSVLSPSRRFVFPVK